MGGSVSTQLQDDMGMILQFFQDSREFSEQNLIAESPGGKLTWLDGLECIWLDHLEWPVVA